jgi:hypothetical protein
MLNMRRCEFITLLGAPWRRPGRADWRYRPKSRSGLACRRSALPDNKYDQLLVEVLSTKLGSKIELSCSVLPASDALD